MNPTLRTWLVRIGLGTWVVVTCALGFQVLNLEDLLSDWTIGFQDTEASNALLRGLVVPLAQTSTKQDILVHLRRLAPNEMIVATDSSLGIGQLTFRFSRAGKLDSILPEYDP